MNPNKNRVCCYCFLFLAILACSVLVGCSSEQPRTYPVSGVVTLDGKPLAGVGVMLQPKMGGSFGYGESDQDGAFTISTFEIGDGAIPGEHGVVIKEPVTGVFASSPEETTDPDPSANPRIPSRYAKVETSGITVEVNSQLEPLKLTLISN